jgi:GMP synthase (glutamine-hydrolysing)
VQPDPAAPLERWGPWLRDRGLAVRRIRPYAGESIPARLEEDGLIVLGGAMSVHDTGSHPWLQDIVQLLQDAVEREIPTLGICLGGQLLAQALGGAVVRGSVGVEAGIAEVEIRPEGENDALLGGLGTFPMGSLHEDAVLLLPRDSCWIAKSPQYPHQAFRVGPAAWGVQFHPEISPATYEGWAGLWDGTDPVGRAAVTQGVERFVSADVDVSRAARTIAHRFADLVTRSVSA